jgi:hypothetical protein
MPLLIPIATNQSQVDFSRNGPALSRPLSAHSSPPLHRKPGPFKYLKLDVDDFVGMVQGNPAHQKHVKCILRRSLDEVLRQVDDQDNAHRQEPASIKKMLKGYATRATRKVVLGWLLDTLAMTVQLPSHRVTHWFEILDYITPKQHRTTVNKWQKLLVELRSMVLAIPGGRGLFRVIQDALRTKGEQGNRIRLSSAVHLVLADFGGLPLI